MELKMNIDEIVSEPTGRSLTNDQSKLNTNVSPSHEIVIEAPWGPHRKTIRVMMMMDVTIYPDGKVHMGRLSGWQQNRPPVNKKPKKKVKAAKVKLNKEEVY